MKVGVVGAGPAGLYFALLLKRADPAHQVEVIERNPPGATYGWGVVFSEETLGALREADPETYEEMTDSFANWNAIDVLFRGQTVRSRGHVFSAISRMRLLRILQERCAQLGVDLRFSQEFDWPGDGGADLIVAADGVHSLVRDRLAGELGTTVDLHSTRYVWFGTERVFDAFTFIFRETEHGLFQVHAYPYDAGHSTFIVECPERVWRRAGLDGATEEESISFCQRLFAPELDGHPLLSNRSQWYRFATVRNRIWHHRNVVLVGDAAHTAHFTIGSGTKLAMEDAISLANALRRHGDMGRAFTDYEMERQPVVERFQEAAGESARYFETVGRYASFDPLQFSFNLLTRSGRITYVNLMMRDPAFANRVDGWFDAAARGGAAPEGPSVVPPPWMSPLTFRNRKLANRVVLSPVGEDSALDGMPGGEHLSQLGGAVASGAGMVLTELVAVSAEGRITPGTPGLYTDEHAAAWEEVLGRVRKEGDAALAARLGHAGARGSTRPRRGGSDRPLGNGGWPLVAASPHPFARGGQVPREMTRQDMVKVLDDFARAAERADSAGFDFLFLEMAHGYLLAGFISPLTNRRTDEFGSTLENRLRFPLEVVTKVREAWPGEKPLGARISATDWIRGGMQPEDAVAVAAGLKDAGCDLVQVLAGQTLPRGTPEYGRFYLVPFSDRVRNEAGIPTVAGGNLTTSDEINTILAAGRADLCVMDVRPQAPTS